MDCSNLVVKPRLLIQARNFIMTGLLLITSSKPVQFLSGQFLSLLHDTTEPLKKIRTEMDGIITIATPLLVIQAFNFIMAGLLLITSSKPVQFLSGQFLSLLHDTTKPLKKKRAEMGGGNTIAKPHLFTQSMKFHCWCLLDGMSEQLDQISPEKSLLLS